MSVRKIINANPTNNGFALGYTNQSGQKSTLDRGNPESIDAYSMYDFSEEDRFVAISGSQGDTTLVSGISGRQIEVNNIVFLVENESQVSIRSGSEFKFAPATFPSGGGISNESTLLRTNPGEDLIINSSVGSVVGSLAYRIV